MHVAKSGLRNALQDGWVPFERQQQGLPRGNFCPVLRFILHKSVREIRMNSVIYLVGVVVVVLAILSFLGLR